MQLQERRSVQARRSAAATRLESMFYVTCTEWRHWMFQDYSFRNFFSMEPCLQPLYTGVKFSHRPDNLSVQQFGNHGVEKNWAVAKTGTGEQRNREFGNQGNNKSIHADLSLSQHVSLFRPIWEVKPTWKSRTSIFFSLWAVFIMCFNWKTVCRQILFRLKRTSN